MLKIKSYSQLQAARSEYNNLLVKAGHKQNNTVIAWLTKEQAQRYNELENAIKQATPFEPELKKAHQIAKVISLTDSEKLGLKLTGKSLVVGLSNGTNDAIDTYVSNEIITRASNANGILSDIKIATLKSPKYSFNRRLNNAQVTRYQQSDGVIGYTRADTVSGKIVKTELNFSELYNKLPITDESESDIPNLVEDTLESLSTSYKDQFGFELVGGDSSVGELPGLATDLLDLANGHAESLLEDNLRDVNTFSSVKTGELGGLGVDPRKQFHKLVAQLPAHFKTEAKVYMSRKTLEAYSVLKDNNGQPLFDITPNTFEGYSLAIDDNLPTLNTDASSSKAIVAFGVPDKAVKMGNLHLKLKDDPMSVDGATVFSQIGRVGLAVRDNTALRFLLCSA